MLNYLQMSFCLGIQVVEPIMQRACDVGSKRGYLQNVLLAVDGVFFTASNLMTKISEFSLVSIHLKPSVTQNYHQWFSLTGSVKTWLNMYKYLR